MSARFVQVDELGQLVAIYNQEGEGLLEREIPADYPELSEWDAGELDFRPSVDKLRASKWEQVKATRAEKYLLAPTPFGLADADTESRGFINGVVSMALIAKAAGSAFEQVFKLADNSRVTLDADEMLIFGVSVAQHIDAVFARGEALFDALNSATTAAELEAIDIDAGWPAIAQEEA